MQTQVKATSLEALCGQFDARQVILYDAGVLSAHPQLAEGEYDRWQIYAKLHLALNQVSRLHAYSPAAEPWLLLAQQLSPAAILFLLYPFNTRIVSLEATQIALSKHLSQPEPDTLALAALQLSVNDLKSSTSKSPDNFHSIFTDLDKSAPIPTPTDTQPITIRKQ